MINDMISVIIPVYNCEKYLRDCIESIINQTYTNYEIILIDDGSVDNSNSICMEYCILHKTVKLYRQDNRGVSSARNLGLSKANGEYIYFIDADDLARPELLKTLYNLLNDNKCDMSVVSHYSNERNVPVGSETVEIFDSYEALCELHEGKKFKGQLWNKLFKKDLLNSVLFNEDIYINEDMLFVQQYLLNCSKVVFQENYLYFYRYNVNSAYNGKYKDKDYTSRIACLLMKEQLVLIYPDLVSYVDKSIIVANIYIIKKMMSERNYYRRVLSELNHEIQNLCNKKTIDIYCGENFSKRLDIYALKINYRVYYLLVFIRKTHLYIKSLLVKLKKHFAR